MNRGGEQWTESRTKSWSSMRRKKWKWRLHSQIISILLTQTGYPFDSGHGKSCIECSKNVLNFFEFCVFSLKYQNSDLQPINWYQVMDEENKENGRVNTRVEYQFYLKLSASHNIIPSIECIVTVLFSVRLLLAYLSFPFL